MFTFNRGYFITAVAVFLIEVLIALFVRDAIIRPYGGDFLVVILIYAAIRSVIQISAVKAAAITLLFSYLIEILQYFRIVDILGLTNNKLAKIVIGYGFSWWDMLAYTLGIISVLIFERLKGRMN